MHTNHSALARTAAVTAWLKVYGDSLGEVRVEVSHFFLSKRLPCDDLERLLHVDGLLGARLEVRDTALGLAVGHGTLLGDHALALLHIDLVADYDKGETLGVHGASLYQELVPPAVQRVEALGVVDIVDQHAAVCTAVESHS